MATANNNVIISRIQNRRGLKQDLPQPLREGEIGFATDSKQVYIGGNLQGENANLSIFETTSGAETFTKSIANTRIIAFTVPHKKFPKNISFDSISKTKLWNITDETYSGSGLNVFNENITQTPTASVTANNTGTSFTLNSSNTYISSGDVVTGDDITGTVTVVSFDAPNVVLSSNQSLTTSNVLTFTPNNIKNILTNEQFKSSGIKVIKNNKVLIGDDTNIDPSSSTDYSFQTTTLGSNVHTLNFRVAPLQTDEVSINYYGNAAIIRALSNVSTIYPGSSAQSFYDQYNIPVYRQLTNDLIRVSETSGKGFIGLEFKHLAVYEDGATISSPNSLSLGTLLASRSDLKSTSEVNVSQSGATITVAVGSNNQYSNSGVNDHILFSDTDDWLSDKALQVSNVQPNTLEVTLPTGNTWQTARAVTASQASLSTVTITADIEGLRSGDYVSFAGANATLFTSGPYQVSNVTSNSFTVTEAGILSAIPGGLDYIIHGTNNTSNVQIISSSHGYTQRGYIDVATSSDSSIGTSNFQIGDTDDGAVLTTNTFLIEANSAVTGNVTGTYDVIINESTANVTPVISYDLSTFTTLPEVLANVANSSEFLDVQYIPGSTNKVYVTTKASADSISAGNPGGAIEFGLHNDANNTLGTLGLNAGSKTKVNNTVKAKLESWLNGLMDSKDVNLFTGVEVSDPYSVGSSNLSNFILNIQTRNSDNTRYIQFATREEAQAFNHICNNIYFATASSEIRGLVNIETNIELLTSESTGGGSKVTTFDDLEDDVITNVGTLQSLSKQIDTADYDSFIIDYTVKYDGTTDGNYRRIGTMYLNVFNNSSTGNSGIIFQDIASDVADTLSGNVVFSASYNSSNSAITLQAVNSTSKALGINYLTKRWSS